MPALPKPQPDLPPSFEEAAVRHHVEMLHHLAAGLTGKFVVAAFFANPKGEDRAGGQISHHHVGDVDGMVEAVMAHAETPHANVYICPNLMRSSLERGKKGGENDVKRQSIEFYEKCGFTLIDTDTNRALTEPIMFLDLHKVQFAAEEES